MENTVQAFMQKNDLEKVWMVRNFKTVYRDGKRNKDKKRIEDKRAANSLHSKVNDILMPQTPPERIYMGLSNMVTRNKQNLLPTEMIIAEMNQGLGDYKKRRTNITTLNDDFKKKLKEENWRTDKVEVGEKQVLVESPSRSESEKAKVQPPGTSLKLQKPFRHFGTDGRNFQDASEPMKCLER
ncbi:hypothetical protein GLOIN_2v1472033 [Rhizophagus irregularis DAOM 181602=DAOM 197198]|nr:hypothetical protein GLOIN_2v1472033 [Rhizophagus irregularis DAOM 181602=DAOM 197198]